MKDWTNPNRTEIVHTSHAGVPIVAEIAPIETDHEEGDPAATKKPCFQSMARRRPAAGLAMLVLPKSPLSGATDRQLPGL